MANVAILGYGVVGSGVAEVLTENREGIARRSGGPIGLSYILVRRDFPDSPFRDKMVRDFSVIENDPSVDIVVEVIGGVGAAKDYTERALRAGKSVVTANKELVAEHGCELLELARANGVSYLFEASVGGGIPIIRPLSQCLAANEIEAVSGILNGTTNYILTRMSKGGLSFADALKEAQEKGYAEADPTADIQGIDVCRKICILASLAFGRQVYPRQVATQGITEVTLFDQRWAEAAGFRIKLLGRALRREGGRLTVYVAPHLIPASEPLAGVEDVFNAITVRGNAVGEVMFYGQGAGKRPTASAVVADVSDIVRRGRPARPAVQWGEGAEDLVVSADGMESRWYVRLADGDASLPEGAVPVEDAPEGGSAFLMPAMSAEALKAALGGRAVGLVLRVLD